jgi:hypothetical protein
VRTYGDLVHATAVLIRARGDAETCGGEPPQRIRARIVSPAGESSGALERTGWLTPYIAETIADDALRAGPGSHVELSVATDATGSLVRTQRQFARLGARDVLVTMRDDDRPAARAVHPTADAAGPQQVVIAG